MATAKELREQRMNLESKINEIIDRAEAENRDLNAEEEANYQKLFKESQETLNRAKRIEARDKAGAGVPVDDPGKLDIDGVKPSAEESMNLAVKGWFNGQQGGRISEEQQEAARAAGINLYSDQLVLPLMNKEEYDRFRANRRNISTAGGGGALIPENFQARLEVAMLDFSPMMEEADTLRTDGGGRMPWPTANDTGNKGQQVGESRSTSEVNPTLGAMYWEAFKFTSNPILIPEELEEDNGVNLSAITPDMLGERLGRIINERGTIGLGNATITGIVPGATTGATAAATNAITLDEVLDLKYSVQNPYRKAGKFMGNDKVFLKMRKLKTTAGEYLWQPSVQAGMPDVFDGSPVVPNNDMVDTLAASAEVLVYGDLKSYKFRQVRQVRLYKLMERYRADSDSVAYIAFVRIDGKILDAGGHPIKKLVMAAS